MSIFKKPSGMTPSDCMRWFTLIFVGYPILIGFFKGADALKCLECVGHATLSGNCTDSSECNGDWCFTTYIHGGKSGSEFVHKGCLSAEEAYVKTGNDSCVKILEYGIIDQLTCVCQSQDRCNLDFTDIDSESGKTSIEADVKCYDCHDMSSCNSGSCIGKWCVVGVIHTNSIKESIQKTCSLDLLPGSVPNGCVKVTGKEQYLCTCNTTFCNTDAWLKLHVQKAIDDSLVVSEIENNKIDVGYVASSDEVNLGSLESGSKRLSIFEALLVSLHLLLFLLVSY